MAKRTTAKKAITIPDEVEIPDVKRRRPELPLRCGQCMFLRRYRTYAVSCDQFGTLPSSLPCERFVADPDQLGNARDVRDALAVLGSVATPTLMVAVMLSGKRVRRHGHVLGDVVYFRVAGGDYLCNYASGVITGATRDDRLVITGGQNFSALLHSKELLGRTAWESKRSSLLKRERINDPAGGLRRLQVRGHTRLVSYEPPAMVGKTRAKSARSNFGGKRTRSKTSGPIILSSGDVR